MCFKKPKLPAKTPQDLQAEKELENAQIARRVQIERDLATEKEATTESALARALGFVGNRSLIAGPKGGAGYIGGGSNKIRGRRRIGGLVAPVSMIAPSASAPSLAGMSGGGGGGGTGGGYSDGGGGGSPYAVLN
jgi:uncharacterized membrane protein YgcG